MILRHLTPLLCCWLAITNIQGTHSAGAWSSSYSPLSPDGRESLARRVRDILWGERRSCYALLGRYWGSKHMMRRVDVIGELYRRGLTGLVERILLLTEDALTVSSCSQVCQTWSRFMKEEEIWRRLLVKMFNSDPAFKRLCLLNDWWRLLSAPGPENRSHSERRCQEIYYKVRNFDSVWSAPAEKTGKILAGGLFSCVKLHGDSLFVGMLDGLIKMWSLSQLERPVRVLEGHEESVTCLDVMERVLVSGSLDHSVRVWSTESSSLLRVLRRQGSPIVMVRLLSDRLLWWTRSGSFQISSWRTFKRVEPDLRFSLMEDPVFCLMEVGEHYVVTTRTQRTAGLNSRDLVVYSSRDGEKLSEKDIFAGDDISCLAIHGHLLYVGCGNTVEVWDINISTCLAIIQSASPDLFNINVKNIAVSDFLLVASLTNGNIFYVEVIKIIERSLLNSREPAIIDWEVSGTRIRNTEQTWKNIDLTTKKLVFGLETRLGDIKVITWEKRMKDSLIGNKGNEVTLK